MIYKVKQIAVLLLVLTLFDSGVTAEERSGCWVQYANLLPNWEPYYESTQLYGRVHYLGYSNVDSEMVENYLKTMEQHDFNSIGSENNWVLFREDCIILIREYMTDAYEIAVWRKSRFHGKMTGSNDLMAMMHENMLCSLDISPEGLFQATGLQLFVCVRDSRSDEPSALNREFYLVGNGACLQLDFVDLACADLDQDGTPELLTVEWGPTSGIFTLVFKVYDLQNSTPYLQAVRLESLPYGRITLTVTDGKAYFEYTQQYYDQKTKTTEYKPTRFYEISLDGDEIVFRNFEGEELPFRSLPGD